MKGTGKRCLRPSSSFKSFKYLPRGVPKGIKDVKEGLNPTVARAKLNTRRTLATQQLEEAQAMFPSSIIYQPLGALWAVCRLWGKEGNRPGSPGSPLLSLEIYIVSRREERGTPGEPRPCFLTFPFPYSTIYP